MSQKQIVVSGIRSTGRLHLGNYFGAVHNFLQMQDLNQCYFFIADYHALTTHPNPEALKTSVKQVLVEYLACGLDPDKVVIYRQSDLKETFELYLMLNMQAYMGELMKTASFKDKARKQPENVNAGLLTYPVLMAADILLHRAHAVPVGKDQEQHLEMTRTFARRFNHFHNTTLFPEPEAYNFGKKLIKVPGLDGTGKMGKSEGEHNAIYLNDPLDIIHKKVMRAVTDAGPTEPNSKVSEPIKNLFTLLELVSQKTTVKHFKESYANCTIRYGDLKKQLSQDIQAFVVPIQEKIRAIENDHAYLASVLKNGAEKATISASNTLNEARKCWGFNNN